MSSPAVTVIVPNYNHARFLRARIDSILTQTYRDFEVLLLDDCSTDDSRAVIESYRGRPGVAIDFNETNSGSPFRQWNRGLNQARGRYVWIAESDDLAEPGLLDRLVGRLESSAATGVAYCGSDDIDADGRTKSLDWYYAPNQARWMSDFAANGCEEIGAWLGCFNSILNASAVVFRRSVAREIGGADESFRFMGDWDFWIRMLERSDVLYVATVLNHFRSHGVSVRARSDRQLFAIGEAYRILAYLVRGGRLGPDLLKLARGGIALRWAKALGGSGLANQLAVSRQAQRADPWAVLRVLKAYLWLRRRGGVGPAQSSKEKSNCQR